MAEIAGLASAILTVGNASAGLAKFIHNVKHAPDEFRCLQEELDALQKMLLEAAAVRAADTEATLTEPIIHCHAVGEAVQAFLNQLNAKPKTKRVEWVLRRGNIATLQKNIAEARQRISLAFSILIA